MRVMWDLLMWPTQGTGVELEEMKIAVIMKIRSLFSSFELLHKRV